MGKCSKMLGDTALDFGAFFPTAMIRPLDGGLPSVAPKADPMVNHALFHGSLGTAP